VVAHTAEHRVGDAWPDELVAVGDRLIEIVVFREQRMQRAAICCRISEVSSTFTCWCPGDPMSPEGGLVASAEGAVELGDVRAPPSQAAFTRIKSTASGM
jgi:hypothetical protein